MDVTISEFIDSLASQAAHRVTDLRRNTECDEGAKESGFATPALRMTVDEPLAAGWACL